MREVLFKVPGDEWERRQFATHAEAMLFAHRKMSSGWLRDEIDVQDEDGSLNVRLPLTHSEYIAYAKRASVK
jgi:hypothetical protein